MARIFWGSVHRAKDGNVRQHVFSGKILTKGPRGVGEAKVRKEFLEDPMHGDDVRQDEKAKQRTSRRSISSFSAIVCDLQPRAS